MLLWSQITSLTIYWGADQRKHQSTASLAFVMGIHRWPVKSPHKGPVTQKRFPFDDVVLVCHVVQGTPCSLNNVADQDDVIKWKPFLRYWTFVREFRGKLLEIYWYFWLENAHILPISALVQESKPNICQATMSRICKQIIQGHVSQMFFFSSIIKI